MLANYKQLLESASISFSHTKDVRIGDHIIPSLKWHNGSLAGDPATVTGVYGINEKNSSILLEFTYEDGTSSNIIRSFVSYIAIYKRT
jgi:hypothetical protein